MKHRSFYSRKLDAKPKSVVHSPFFVAFDSWGNVFDDTLKRSEIRQQSKKKSQFSPKFEIHHKLGTSMTGQEQIPYYS